MFKGLTRGMASLLASSEFETVFEFWSQIK